MGIHHVALATRDAKATHAFYTGPMGFRLVKVEVGRAGREGWMKHLFYDTGGGGMIAFWDLHDAGLPEDWSPAIADGLGLPRWTNHLAFEAADAAGLEACKQRWLDHGLDVVEIDHGWCRSVYTHDPNDIMVEFCLTTRALDGQDAREAAALLEAERPEPAPPPPVVVHRGSRAGGRP
jgi:catechol 2,3-dioxygenase-like lactoylglutathione lyase family enzyme